MDRLFVFGSLKADGTLDQVELSVHDGYPMLRSGSALVQGEVYRISDSLWPALDAWEDVPRIYSCRRRTLLDGRDVWVYEAS